MKKTIYYCQYLNHPMEARRYRQNPLIEPELGFYPVPVLEYRKEDNAFTKCPAYRQWAKNTFVVPVPFDFEIKTRSDYAGITVSNEAWLPYIWLNDLSDWANTRAPIIQLLFGFVFWTEQPDVWLRLTGSPEAYGSNIRVVEAQYPMSGWTRPANIAFRIIDPQQPVVLKRGEPIQHVSFFTGAVNETFELTHKVPDSKIADTVFRNEFMRDMFPGKAWNILSQRSNASKCPFARFFKKQ